MNKWLDKIGIKIRKWIHSHNYLKGLFYIFLNKRRVRKKKKNNEVLNVVFIVQYIPSWNKQRLIYERMLQDSSFNPTIVCVPLEIYDHQISENCVNDTYNYFVQHGYNAINALNDDRSWFDIKTLKPDYVFHSRPYNGYMPIPYTSRYIVKYALICNVLYGASLTHNGQDVTLNKNYYRDVYIYYAFDDEEKKFYQSRFKMGMKLGIQKCFLHGSIGMEQILESKSEQEDSSFRKTILWTPRWSTDPYIGGSNFFNYKDVLFELAKTNSDVLFIIRPHPLMFNNFLKTKEMSEAEVEEFKKYCAGENNIILDESKEYSDVLWKSDILITDSSGIVPEFYITGKPVLYCYSNLYLEYVDFAKKIMKTCYPIKNVQDILFYVNELLAGTDNKSQDRQNCIDECFSDVKNNSISILENLKNDLILK